MDKLQDATLGMIPLAGTATNTKNRVGDRQGLCMTLWSSLRPQQPGLVEIVPAQGRGLELDEL